MRVGKHKGCGGELSIVKNKVMGDFVYCPCCGGGWYK